MPERTDAMGFEQAGGAFLLCLTSVLFSDASSRFTLAGFELLHLAAEAQTSLDVKDADTDLGSQHWLFRLTGQARKSKETAKQMDLSILQPGPSWGWCAEMNIH